jgi:vitamin K-dependent gamma-carboxylase
MTVTDRTGPRPGEGRLATLLERWNAPRDGAGLGAFRSLFGALLCFSVARFWAYGWIDELYVRPAFHFTFFGFDWVRPWPGAGMYLHFAVMALAALSLCVGCFSRVSAAIFFLTFTYAELIEKASYLNHYYFVSLTALLLATMPCGSSLSLDACWRRKRGRPPPIARAWCYGLLRTQLGLVYFFAGLAKLNADWLFSAQPLGTWLGLHADAPLIGPWLASRPAAYVASYAGAAFDLSIPLWLSWRRSRPYAYAVGVVFHVAVWLLFPIGVFSWVMIVATTLFFEPSWPRRWLRAGSSSIASGASEGRAAASPSGRLTPLSFAALVAYLLVQLALPLRYLLYPGNVNWHEQGFRFAWRVMLVEKAGQVELTVLTDDDDRRFVVYPRESLTPLQYKMMTTQPDMIQQFARHLQRRFLREGHRHVRVYADAWAAMNGRPRQRLLDPSVDLADAPWTLWPKPWIVPLQNSN